MRSVRGSEQPNFQVFEFDIFSQSGRISKINMFTTCRTHVRISHDRPTPFAMSLYLQGFQYGTIFENQIVNATLHKEYCDVPS